MKKLALIFILSGIVLLASPSTVKAADDCGWDLLGLCNMANRYNDRKEMEAQQATAQHQIDAQTAQQLRFMDTQAAQQKALLDAMTNQQRFDYQAAVAAIQAQSQIATEGILQAGDVDRVRVQAYAQIAVVKTIGNTVVLVLIVGGLYLFAPGLFIRRKPVQRITAMPYTIEASPSKQEVIYYEQH
jgi:hypothetical protein